jgi:5-methylcytosine-specific restriction endonuclease McrA
MDEPGKRNTATIPPAIRRKVLARDRHCCRAPGCGHTKFLEVHHIRSRADGGGNDLENLITLCSACHRLGHEKPEVMAHLAGV